jgi:hypothetical protein
VATAASGAKAKLAEAHAKQLAEARARERASQLDLKFGGLAELEAGEALLVRERYCRQVATAAMAGGWRERGAVLLLLLLLCCLPAAPCAVCLLYHVLWEAWRCASAMHCALP